MRWHCPPDTGFEIGALAVWGRARYLSVTEAPHNTDFHTWMGKKHFCFFQTAETGNRTPNSGVEGSGANHYPRAPAQLSRGSFEQSDRYQRLREYWADFGCEKTAGRDLHFCGSPASAVLKSSFGMTWGRQGTHVRVGRICHVLIINWPVLQMCLSGQQLVSLWSTKYLSGMVVLHKKITILLIRNM